MRYDYFVHRALRDFYFHPLLKTEWIGLAGRNYDKGFENSAQLFCTLSQEEQDNIPKALQDLYQRLKWTYTHEMFKRERKLAVYHMMWGRIYLAVCFYMYNEEFWVKTVIPLMEQMEPDKLVRQDMLYLKRLTAETRYPKSLLAEECRKIPAPIQQPITKYNFQTRQLSPYSDQWENGMKGELWYLWEKDAICIVSKKYKYPIARGFAAALLANNMACTRINFSYVDIYKAYNYALQDANIPGRCPFQEQHRMLVDWRYTLEQLESFEHDFTGYFDRYQRMLVGQVMRDYFNPYKQNALALKMKWKGSFSCNLKTQQEQQLLFATMPDKETTQSAPMVWFKGIKQPFSKSRSQVSGFLASVINYAIYCHGEQNWDTLNFADKDIVSSFISAWEKFEPIIVLEKLEDLNFVFSINILDLCQAYMDIIVPMTREALERNPTLPIVCWEGDKLYSYMYSCEQQAREDFLHSELYANLNSTQQRFLYGYISRFLEFLAKNYPVSSHTQFEQMQAIGKDVPNIRVQLHNEITIIRPGEKPKKKDAVKKTFTKFEYIISDDKKEILKIHKRIELYLSSPAKLRDELRRLQDEGLIALPMENPTAILRALQRVWGKKAPKEGSFKTTWGRVKC